MKRNWLVLLSVPLLAFAIVALLLSATSQTAYSRPAAISLGTTYTQNFDSLSNSGTANPWVNDSTLIGWYAAQAGGSAPTLSTYRADNGTSTAGALYSYGTTSSTERALGSLGSGTPGNLYYGVLLQNDTSVDITGFLVTYTGEQWRQGGNTAQQKLDFAYQISTSLNNPISGTWTDVNVLDFVSPIVSGTAPTGALDGNATANRITLTAEVTVTVVPGQQIMFRWLDTNDTGNDHALAVDDLTIVPISAPPPPPEADLGLAKSGPAVALAGDTITYTIRVSNTGTAAATGTIVTDTLPTEVAFVTYTTSLANSFTQVGNDLIWDLGDVPTDTANAEIVVEAIVSPTLANGSSFTNTVIGTTTYTETGTANNSASVTTFIGAPDLVIVKSGPAEVNAGDQVVYTLAYTNTGDIAATNVALVDQLPTSFTYITDSLGSGVQSGGRMTWTLGTLNPNDFGSIVLTATSSTAGDYQNVATISGNPIDSNPLDNTSSVTTTVVGVDPYVAKSAGSTLVFGGELITYTLTYGNQGNLTATLTLTDQLPIGFAVADIAADTSGLAFTDGATERVWTASVAPGTSLSFTFALTVPAAISSGTRFTNTLAVSALEAGDNPANNSAVAASTAYQIVPISTARAGVNGQTFAVEGQVVVVPGTYSAGEWELQDASGAIAMFYTPAPSVSLGDRIRLVATRSTFSGQQQLGLPSYFRNLGAGTPPAAKPFTTGEVLAGTAQGWLAVISGTLSNLGTCTGNYDIFVNDGSGAADVFINSFSAGVINPCANGYTNGDWVQVTGFSTIFSSTTRLAYEIRPRAISDFVRFPRVLSTDPIGGATEVPLAATITATFNMTMTNVDATNFVVMGPSGAVAGTVAYDAATKTAIFTPTAALNSNTLYTATLKAALTADNGKSFMPAQDYVWTFTTHQTTPDLSTSTKANSVNGAVKPGEWVTYTFTLNNTGDANANATITDVLSPYYAVGSLLDFTQPTTGTLTWTGVVTAGQSITVQFVAQVKSVGQLPIGPALILNSAGVSDGVHAPVVVNDPTPPTLTIYGLYLPMIRR